MKIISTRLSKVKVPHDCFFCNNKFPKGTTMWRYTLRYDGRLSSVYECMNHKKGDT